MKIYDTATSAIMRQTQRMEQSAKNVSKLGDVQGEGAKVDLAKEAVTRIEATNITKANVSVIKAEDERTQAILDIFA
jgi:flagellar basal body rod protein FlgC